jgi:hypothetical protein
MVKIIAVDDDHKNHKGCLGYWNVFLSEKLIDVFDHFGSNEPCEAVSYFSMYRDKGPHLYVQPEVATDEMQAMALAIAFLARNGVELGEDN